MNGLEFPFFTPDHEALRDLVRGFIKDEVLPHGDQWEEDGFIPRSVLKEMGRLGLFGIRYATEYGGSDLDTISTAVFAEELGRSSYGGFAVTALVHTDMATPHLHHGGTSAQKARYMPDLIAGNKIAAVAMTESGAGSDLASMRTTAKRVGNEWVLNGSKMYITNGVHGDVFFVAAKTGDAPLADRSHQVSMFIVEKGTPGFSVARPLKKHGWLSSDTAELVFNDCRIPEANLLGEEHKGFYALMKNLQNERIVLGAQAIGEASKAIELTLSWVTQRKAFGGTLWPAPWSTTPPGVTRKGKSLPKKSP
jgi:acyl-CoA dehydrogenase